MTIALSVLHGEHSYYASVPEDKQILVGPQQDADICIPDLAMTLAVSWGSKLANIRITEGKHTHRMTAHQDVFAVIDDDAKLAIYFTQAYPAQSTLRLPADCVVDVGRNPGFLTDGSQNHAVIQFPFVSGHHFRLVRERGEAVVTDMGSKNGLCLNGKRIQQAVLRENDVLSIYTVQIRYSGDQLIFENVGDRLTLRQVQALDSRKAAPLDLQKRTRHKHIRSPRLVANVAPQVISLEHPPQPGAAPQISWMSVLITPMISVALMVVLVILMGMSPVMLIMSGVMSVISAITAVFSYRKQKRSHGAMDALIDGKYTQYLDSVAAQLKDAQSRQLDALITANPAPQDCLTMAQTRSRALWERTPTDTDFLSVRLGLGTIGSAVTAVYQQPQVVISETELEAKAKLLAANSRTIPDAPILCSLAECRQIGFIGERMDAMQLARSMITGLAAAHSYDEVKIVALVPERELSAWDWLRWLPHCADDQRSKRYIFTSLEDAEPVLDDLDEILSRRRSDDSDRHDRDPADIIPHYVFIIAAHGMIERHPIRKSLLTSLAIGCSALFLYDRLAMLPKECDEIIELSQGCGQMYNKLNSSQKLGFRLDTLSVSEADRFARALAPVYTETEKGAASLTTSISFLDGYGVKHPQQLDIGTRWKNAQPFRSLSVPVAVMPGGDLFHFDIHEKRHGVNGIVAGMPGSGKTEMVQSWLLSLAVNFSPQDVSFILIDFKGTGMIAPFRKLPHLAGAISNLDTVIDRNLAAIRSEVHRREAIIDKYSDCNVKNVNDLNKSYAKGLVPEKLPILLVVIDEFAEFKKNFPDFGAEIDSLTSKGRALGIFVVLMTQKPAGVVSPKSEDNIKFRWCLRVANYSASREMLGKPDAAKISNPGRAFIKVGEDDVYEQVQSFWSGAPYDPSEKTGRQDFSPISTVELSGKHRPCEQVEKRAENQSNESQIDAVVRHIAAHCEAQGIPAAEKVWTERLPERVSVMTLLNAGFDGERWPETASTAPVIGLVDDPDNQRQYPLVLDFAKTGHTAVYGAPVTGKTTLLQTLILSIATTRRPDQVSIYVMDFGGWNLNILKKLPHVGGIANDNEPERLKKLVLLLTDFLQERKQKFSRAGVGNITAYRESTGEQLPDILLVVDNFSPVLKMYPDLDQFFVTLTGSGANYGIYLVATGSASNSIPIKISQNIKNSLALQMIDKSDYTYLVGKTTGKLAAVLGRGFAKGNPPLEFQTALPAPGDSDKTVAENIQKIAAVMSARWGGTLPAPIPEMPERIPFGSVRSEGICLGLSSEKVLPVSYDPRKQHFLLISGTAQSGKSNLLQAAAKQMRQKFGGKLYVFDIKGNSLSPLKSAADAYLSTPGDIDAFVEGLRPELQYRHSTKQSDPSAGFTPIAIIIDDYAQFHKAVSNETISRLLAVVKLGAGLDLYLITAGDSYDVASLVNKGEAVALSMARSKQAVMLGGCMNDHGAIQTKATFSQKSAALRELEGIFVHNAELTAFKAMHSIGE